jgi:hypothetical protein
MQLPELLEWRPRADDRIVGRVVDRDVLTAHDGRENVRLVVRADAGSTLRGRPLPEGRETSVLCAALKLRRWARRADPQVGDRIDIQYRGRHDSGANRMHRFAIHEGG